MAIAKGTQQPVVYDEAAFNSRVEATRTCHVRSHEGAAEAVANAYIFTRETADAEGLALFQTAIADYNAAITKHNKGIGDRFERADKFQAGKLSPDDPMYSKPDDPALLKAYEDERLVLLADHSVDKADRRKLKRVTAEKKEDANRYTAHVKYVLGFDRPNQATLVSSYCLALEWIDANCGALPNVDVPVIKMAVLAAGGFSAIVEAQRSASKDPNAATEREATEKFLREKAMEKIKAMEPKGNVSVAALTASGGFVLLLGRTNGGTVDVLGEAKLPAALIDRAVNELGRTAQPDAEPATEFVGRALILSKLIKEGLIVNFEEGKAATVRSVAVRPDQSGNTALVFSVRYPDAASVLIARPREPGILPVNDRYGVMPTKDFWVLEQKLLDPLQRSMITISAEANPVNAKGQALRSVMAWNLTNSVPGSAANERLFWHDLANAGVKPLDIAGFDPQFDGVLGREEMVRILGLLPKLKSKKAAKEHADRSVQLGVKEQKLYVKYGDAPVLELDFPNNSAEVVKLRLKVGEAQELFEKLVELDIEQFHVAGEGEALFRVSWDDAFGFYDFHMPACTREGRLISRRVFPMRVRLPAFKVLDREPEIIAAE